MNLSYLTMRAHQPQLAGCRCLIGPDRYGGGCLEEFGTLAPWLGVGVEFK